MRSRSLSILLLLWILFVNSWMYMGKSLPSAETSQSGVYTISGQFTDSEGEDHSAKRISKYTLMIVNISETNVTLKTTRSDGSTVEYWDVDEGEWSKVSFLVHSDEVTTYTSYDLPMSFDFSIPDSLASGSGLFEEKGHPYPFTVSLELWVDNPSEYTESLHKAFSDYFDLPESYGVSIGSTSLTYDSTSLSASYTLTGCLDEGYFIQNKDGDPFHYTLTYSLDLQFDDNGFLTSFNSKIVRDAGTYGKYVLEYNYGTSVLDNVASLPFSFISLFLGLAVLASYLRFRSARRSQ